MMRRLRQWLRPPALPAAQPRLRVLMVCMGNICRSPTAEGVLRARLQRAGLDGLVAVESAGTTGFHSGEAPDPRAVRHAAGRGYDLSGIRARAVVPADFERFDHLLAMDEANLAWLEKRAPEGAAQRLGLLMSHAANFKDVVAVPDPYYGTAAGFDRVLDLVEDACDGLVSRLQSDIAAAGGAKVD